MRRNCLTQLKHLLEPVSKVPSATTDDLGAAPSSVFTKKSSVYPSGYTSGFFARLPRLAPQLVGLATKVLLRPVLVSGSREQSDNHLSLTKSRGVNRRRSHQREARCSCCAGQGCCSLPEPLQVPKLRRSLWEVPVLSSQSNQAASPRV